MIIHEIKYPSGKVIYTANIGGVNNIIEDHYKNSEYSYLFFADSTIESNLWKIIKVKPEFKDSRKQARMYKWLVHKYINANYSLWIDSNVIIKVDINSLIEKYLSDADIAICLHGIRNCIYKEAEVCRKHHLDYAEVIDKQMEKYKSEGYPENNGLYETTVILRRHTKEIEKLNEAVWNEICNGSIRDQLSFDYVVWKLGIRVNTLPGNFHTSNETGFKILEHIKGNRKYIKTILDNKKA